MNLGTEAGDPLEALLYVQLNMECSSMTVGTKKGFSIYSIQAPGPNGVRQIHSSGGWDGRIVSRLRSSCLVAQTSFKCPRLLHLSNFETGERICAYTFPDTIVGVQLNKQHTVVILEGAIYIYSLAQAKLLRTINGTPRNPLGLCALTCKCPTNYMAYPGSNKEGRVIIYDMCNLRCITVIEAHCSPIVALAFSSNGKQLATASQTGTIVRVWSIPQGKFLKEFRRGVVPVTVYSLSFSLDNHYLALSSSSPTVHVFRLADPDEERSAAGRDVASGGEATGKEVAAEAMAGERTWMDVASSMAAVARNYLPEQTRIPVQERAFATARLREARDQKTICCIGNPDGTSTPRVTIACSDGTLHTFTFDPASGGECVLLTTDVIR